MWLNTPKFARKSVLTCSTPILCSLHSLLFIFPCQPLFIALTKLALVSQHSHVSYTDVYWVAEFFVGECVGMRTTSGPPAAMISSSTCSR
eukprot:142415-Pyramimonas_sp.AAC.1